MSQTDYDIRPNLELLTVRFDTTAVVLHPRITTIRANRDQLRKAIHTAEETLQTLRAMQLANQTLCTHPNGYHDPDAKCPNCDKGRVP